MVEGGGLLATGSEARPETWYQGWSRRLLLVAWMSKVMAARTWDLVVMLVVKQNAGQQEGGWSTKYIFVCYMSIL